MKWVSRSNRGRVQAANNNWADGGLQLFEMNAAAAGLELQSGTAAVDFSLKMVALLLALERRCHRKICHHTPAAGFRVNIDGDFLRKAYGDTAARGIEAAIAGGLFRKTCHHRAPGGSS